MHLAEQKEGQMHVLKTLCVLVWSHGCDGQGLDLTHCDFRVAFVSIADLMPIASIPCAGATALGWKGAGKTVLGGSSGTNCWETWGLPFDE